MGAQGKPPDLGRGVVGFSWTLSVLGEFRRAWWCVVVVAGEGCRKCLPLW